MNDKLNYKMLVGMITALIAIPPGLAHAQTCNAICADPDRDNVRDEICNMYGCDGDGCAGALSEFGDVGGQFGTCAPDGVLDNNDYHHVLNCMMNVSPDRTSEYGCSNLTVDVGSQFSCEPDGMCDLSDLLHIRAALMGTGSCDCSGSTDPPGPPEIKHKWANVVAITNTQNIQAGQMVTVDVYLDGTPQDDFLAYELPLVVTGGTAGQLQPAGIEIADSPDHVFSGESFEEAHNHNLQKLVAAADFGVDTADRFYLGTAKFKASKDTEGTFLIQVDTERAMLRAEDPNTRINIGTDTAAAVKVKPSTARLKAPWRGRIGIGTHR